MKYILCEDSGSGYKYFEYLRDTYSSKDKCKVLSSNGNSNYQDYLENLIKELRQGDVLILAFDNVEVDKGFNPKNIIFSAKYNCEQLGVKLYHTAYYCLEELFLSYKYLEEMFIAGEYKGEDKEKWVAILHYICDSTHKCKEYYIDNELVNYVKQVSKKAGKTKEKFTKAVLTHVSGSIFGDFKITDGAFGKCWLTSCDYVNIRNKDYKCRNCSLRFRNKTSTEKASELEQNSLSVLAVPFSCVLKD